MIKSLNTFLIVAFIGLNLSSYAQEDMKEGQSSSEPASSAFYSADEILIEIGDKKVKVAQFAAVYKKNNPESDQEAMEEYLELYINFRLKVQDAEALGMDTLEKFKKELAGYRAQLAEPYLSDNEVTDALIVEAYERMKFEVKASHILVKVGPSASPKDTLAAYNKALSVKKRLEKGEDFAKVAREIDPDARGNGGSLGYFSALRMLYSFETAVYNTEVGKIAGPVRTSYGYHLIKVEEKRPNTGELTVAHIMTRIPQEATEADKEVARMKIDEIYEKLKGGESFEDLAAQYSEDKGSANRAGVLPPFTAGKMVPEFEGAAFALENDEDYTKPVETQYGYHIIKRIHLKELGTFEEMKPELKQKIARDSRSRKSKVSFLNRMKEEYGYKEYPGRISEFYKAIDSSYFHTEWKAALRDEFSKDMFKLGDSTASQKDFAKYLDANRTRRRPGNINAWLDKGYEKFNEDYITAYENVRLEKKYPEFKLLMQEYHDGILLFDLTDEKVWSKAVKDSAGLAKFYNKHKNEYMWGERLEAVVYSCADETVAKEVRKNVKARSKKGYEDKDILEMANVESQLNLEIERAKFSKGDHAVVDQIEWKKGLSDNIAKENRIYFVEVINRLSAQPKELSEVKGLMTSSYQTELEEEWLEELREKYPVTVYKEKLSLIK